MNEFQRVLAEFVLPHIPADRMAVRVTSTDIVYERGFGGSDVTPAGDPTLELHVHYVDKSGGHGVYIMWDESGVQLTMNLLLAELIRLAEQEETN